MMILTASAIAAVGRFIANCNKPTGDLRIEMTDDSGCSGRSYRLRPEGNIEQRITR